MDKRAKCIILICPTKNWGGIEKNVQLRAAYFGKKGYQVIVILLTNTFENKFLNLPNVTVKTINSRGGDLNIFVILNYIKIFKKYKPITVFAALKKDWWLVSLSAYITKVPHKILYLGNIRKIRNSLKYKLVFKVFKAKVLVNSNSLKSYLLSSSSFFNEQNLFRIYNGINLPKKPEASLKLPPHLEVPKDAFIVGCAGWLNYRKGFDLLPEIVRNISANIHIVHVGSGGLDLDAEELLSKNSDVKNRIHFLGYQNNMGAFFQRIDMFLLCSREEGMANVLLECLGHGKPIVSTKVPGSEELLDNGEYGILTTIEDTKAMAKGINAINAKTITFSPENLKSRIVTTFSFDKMMTKTEKLFLTNNL
ncbi:hypothetical protein GCM10011414_19240 [Croceivirga lutea]|uniref:glycosyltransferase n=1 Tax=Croceivirga lutea TaxID=1775167 RepID=UPI001639F167|nr:glycosyltransferase [Croceivirga lutea]GGG49575.1 hypothetical protein GCM10011414_19240 [Croceivirga lutea]